VVDVMGLILAIMVTAACVQDRDGTRPLLWKLAAGRAVTLIWADGGYVGKPARCTASCRSSSGPMTCTPSRCCPAAGWWSGRSAGS
jgi:hypothetical protein